MTNRIRSRSRNRLQSTTGHPRWCCGPLIRPIVLAAVGTALLVGAGASAAQSANTTPSQNSGSGAEASATETARQVLERLCHGKLDYPLYEGSRVDCLQDGYAMVVVEADRWHEAMGRAMFYAAVTHTRPGVVVLMRSHDDLRYTNRLYTPIRELDLNIKVWIEWVDE